MSLVYLLAQDDFDIRAITVSGTGLVHCDAGVDQVLGLLELVGADDVPVACGPDRPLEGFNAFPTSWRVGADELYGLDLPAGGKPVNLSAPELIVSVVGASDRRVLVYADGPQTNLASALRLDPSIAEKIERVFAMGGAFDVAGNTDRNPDAEWNIWVDPVAADEVFRSLPVTLVPLDATNQVPLHIFHLAALEEAAVTPGGRAMVTMLQGNEQLAFGGLFFWDQLTAGLLVDTTLGSAEERMVEVIVGDDRTTAGATRFADAGSPVNVVTDVDASRFETEFLSTIAGTEIGSIETVTDMVFGFDGDEWSVQVPAEAAPGTFTVDLSNGGEGDVLVVFGWLIEGGTLDDAEAWDSIDQPPFYDFERAIATGPATQIYAVVELTEPRDYVLYGLDFLGGRPTLIGVITVSD